MYLDYNDKEYEGTKEEIILQLHNEWYTARKIGIILGTSHASICRYLAKHRQNGRLDYSALSDPQTYAKMTDEEIAGKYKVKLSGVTARRKLFNKNGDTPKRSEASIQTRQRFLSRYLFRCEPGYNFGLWLYEITSDDFPEIQGELLRDFYIDGVSDKGSYARMYRSKARESLKKKVESWTKSKLLDVGAIK